MRAQPYLSPAAFEEFPNFGRIMKEMGYGRGRMRMPKLASAINAGPK